MAEQTRRIFVELHTYVQNKDVINRALLNIDAIDGILENNDTEQCSRSKIILNGGTSIEVVEKYNDIIEKIKQLRSLSN